MNNKYSERKKSKISSITIYDVAKAAGVSLSTVSRVLNDSDLVGKNTKFKVQKIMDEMNYIPNQIARGLMNNTSKAIGLIIPDIANPFFAELIQGVEDVANKNGFSMFLCNSNYNSEKEKAYMIDMAERRVDGVIIISAFKQDLELIKRLNKTMKIITIQTRIEEIDGVKTDDQASMKEAINHLILLGHKKIAFICFDLRGCKERYKGYTEMLQLNNIQIKEEYIREYSKECNALYNNKENMGYIMTKELLELPEPPTAIQAMNDYIASGAYLAIKEKKLSIPKDISIIGFDNISISKLLNPALTTVSQPIYAMGETGGELLMKNILDGSNPVPRMIVLPTKFIIRESTAPPSN